MMKSGCADINLNTILYVFSLYSRHSPEEMWLRDMNRLKDRYARCERRYTSLDNRKNYIVSIVTDDQDERQTYRLAKINKEMKELSFIMDDLQAKMLWMDLQRPSY